MLTTQRIGFLERLHSPDHPVLVFDGATGTSLQQMVLPPGYRGTPIYMSPQHFTVMHPDELCPRSTIYSLGVVLFEILHPHGRQPFLGDARRLQGLHLFKGPPDLPDASDAEARVIRRCLEKDAEKRYATPYELLNDLEGRLPHGTSAARCVSAAHEQAWQGIQKAMQERHFEDAYQSCRKLLRECPDHDEGSELHKELEERRGRAGELLAAVRDGLGKQGLDDLRDLLAKADEAFLDHPELASTKLKFDDLVRRYETAIYSFRCAIDSAKCNTAQVHFETARSLNPGCCERDMRARTMAVVMARLSRDLDAIYERGLDMYNATWVSFCYYWREMREVMWH